MISIRWVLGAMGASLILGAGGAGAAPLALSPWPTIQCRMFSSSSMNHRRRSITLRHLRPCIMRRLRPLIMAITRPSRAAAIIPLRARITVPRGVGAGRRRIAMPTHGCSRVPPTLVEPRRSIPSSRFGPGTVPTASESSNG